MMHAITIMFPLFASLVIALMFRAPEKWIKYCARACGLISCMLAINSAFYWQEFLFNFQFLGHDFFIDLNYDRISAVFSMLTAFCAAVIIHFSSFYLHKEKGYARFFSLFFLLISGMQIISLADNLFTFFIGWEFLGIASYFLISFYWQRKESVTNAIKVFAIYRIGDLGLMSCMILMHLTAHADVRFSNLVPLESINGITILAVLGVLTAAFAKSAQPPFSYWLPKAMEGPTPSSAIFYGALAVHAGALLLLRMSPLWSTDIWPNFIIGAVGAIGALLGAGSARIQTSIKGRLAMASVSQVGIIFVEISLGYYTLALYHITAHALYRSVQLIISPSIVSYFFDFGSKESSRIRLSRLPIEGYLPQRLRSTLYVLAMQDYFSDLSENLTFDRLLRGMSTLPAIMTFLLSLVILYISFGVFYVVAASGLYFSLLALRTSHRIGFLLVLASELIISFHVKFNLWIFLIFLLPWAILFIETPSNKIGLFFGFFTKSPLKSFVLMVSGAAIIGIPPFPSFLLSDIVLIDLFEHSLVIAFLGATCHAVNGYVIFRNLALITMGQYYEEKKVRIRRF